MPKVLPEIDPKSTQISNIDPNIDPNPTHNLTQPDMNPNQGLHLGLEKKVDLRRINLDALKPWIADRIARLVTEEVVFLPLIFQKFQIFWV